MVEPVYRRIGLRIRELRQSSKWSQEDLAERLSPPMTRASMANIETAKQRLLTHTALQLCDLFGVTPDALLLPTASGVLLSRGGKTGTLASWKMQRSPQTRGGRK